MEINKLLPQLLSLNWESLRDILANLDPFDNNWYMIVINKGQTNEYRTKYMTWQETNELIGFALDKKKLRITAAL